MSSGDILMSVSKLISSNVSLTAADRDGSEKALIGGCGGKTAAS